jgi:hypothetical protein
MIYVKIIEPRGRKVFINGVYDEKAGTIPCTLALSPGQHIFETLITRGRKILVDHRACVSETGDNGCIQVSDGETVTIELEPVDPPEPI